MSYNIEESIKGLIFDFDGTVVDNMPVHLVSWKEAFAAHGASFGEDFFYEQAGVSLIGVVEKYNERFSAQLDPEEVVALKNKLYMDHIPEQRVIGPVFEIIKDNLDKRPMAVATGSSREIVVMTMRVLELDAYFQGIVSADDVKNHKPAPDCFLQAASIIDVAPKYCEVFEDGELGLQAARVAGMKATDIRKWL